MGAGPGLFTGSRVPLMRLEDGNEHVIINLLSVMSFKEQKQKLWVYLNMDILACSLFRDQEFGFISEFHLSS